MQIAYTIGRTSAYNKALTEPKPAGSKASGPYKIGEFVQADGTQYPGGWVWKTPSDAIGSLFGIDKLNPEWHHTDFSVYSIRLPNDWDSDTKPGENGIHNLKNDAQIICQIFGGNCILQYFGLNNTEIDSSGKPEDVLVK